MMGNGKKYTIIILAMILVLGFGATTGILSVSTAAPAEDAGAEALVESEGYEGVFSLFDIFISSGLSGLLEATAGLENDVLEKGSVVRIGGDNRYETSALLAENKYLAEGGANGAHTVIIARGDDAGNFADGLAGSVLAGVVDAPVLLTRPHNLPTPIGEVITELGAEKAYVLGGEAAISGDVFDDLEALGLDVERVFGETRFATAVEIAEKAAGLGEIQDYAFIVNGTATPDALVAGASAFRDGVPILQVGGDIPAVTAEALAGLGIENAYLIGGTAVISEDVESGLDDLTNVADRLAGINRYLTSVEFAEAMFEGGKDVVLSGGPDARLADAIGACIFEVPILYVQSIPPEVEDYLRSVITGSSLIRIIGGYQAVSVDVEDEVNNMIDEAWADEQIVEYTVTFDGNGGELAQTEVVVEAGETVDEADFPTVSREGYEFVEWNTADDGSGDEFTAAVEVTADLVVYAVWEEIEIEYTVTFDGNGGEPAQTEVVVEAGETVDEADFPTVSREGYDFVEWNTADDGSGDEFTAAVEVTADLVVYAVWEEIEIEFTVTFDGNGGEPAQTEVVVAAGETVDEADFPTVSRTGYIFIEWNTADDGSGDEFTAAVEVTADLVVYAFWTEESPPPPPPPPPDPEIDPEESDVVRTSEEVVDAGDDNVALGLTLIDDDGDPMSGDFDVKVGSGDDIWYESSSVEAMIYGFRWLMDLYPALIMSEPVNFDAEGKAELTFSVTAAGVYEDVPVEVDGVEIGEFDVTVEALAADSLSITEQPSETIAGEIIAPAPAAKVSDIYGNPIEGEKVEVSLSEGAFDAGEKDAITGDAGIADFEDLVIKTAGTAYTITFDAPDATGVDAVESAVFDVLPAEAINLRISKQPAGSGEGTGAVGDVTLETVDEYGNPSSQGLPDSLPVTATLSDAHDFTAESTAEKDIGADAGDGEVTFDNLEVVTTENIYGLTITFSAGEWDEVESQEFNVYGFTGVDAGESAVERTSEATVTAGEDNVTLELEVADQGGTPIEGELHVKVTGAEVFWHNDTVTFDGGGEAELILSVTAAGVYEDVSVEVDGVQIGEFDVTVEPAGVDAGESTVERTSGAKVAAGNNNVELALTIADEYGNPVSGELGVLVDEDSFLWNVEFLPGGISGVIPMLQPAELNSNTVDFDEHGVGGLILSNYTADEYTDVPVKVYPEGNWENRVQIGEFDVTVEHLEASSIVIAGEEGPPGVVDMKELIDIPTLKVVDKYGNAVGGEDVYAFAGREMFSNPDPPVVVEAYEFDAGEAHQEGDENGEVEFDDLVIDIAGQYVIVFSLDEDYNIEEFILENGLDSQEAGESEELYFPLNVLQYEIDPPGAGGWEEAGQSLDCPEMTVTNRHEEPVEDEDLHAFLLMMPEEPVEPANPEGLPEFEWVPFDAGTTPQTTDEEGKVSFDDLVVETAGAYGILFVFEEDFQENFDFYFNSVGWQPPSGGELLVIPGPVDAAESGVGRLSPAIVEAGEDNVELMFTIKDEYGNLIWDGEGFDFEEPNTITLDVVVGEGDNIWYDSTAVNGDTPVEFADGVATLTLDVTEAGVYEDVPVEVDGVQIGEFDVAVEPGEAELLLLIEEAPGDVVAGEVIDVPPMRVVDEYWNNVPNTWVYAFACYFDQDAGEEVEYEYDEGTTERQSDGEGIVVFDDLVINTAGFYWLDFVLDEDFTYEDEDPEYLLYFGIDVLPAELNADESSVERISAEEVLAGEDNVELEIAIADEYGNPISEEQDVLVGSGDEVWYDSDNGDAKVLFDEEGEALLPLTVTEVGVYEDVPVEVDGVHIGEFDVTITAAGVDSGKSDVVLTSDDTVLAGEDNVDLALTIADEYGNLINDTLDVVVGSGDEFWYDSDNGDAEVLFDEEGKAELTLSVTEAGVYEDVPVEVDGVHIGGFDVTVEAVAHTVSLSGEDNVEWYEEVTKTYTAALDHAIEGVNVVFALSDFAEANIKSISEGDIDDLVDGGVTVQTNSDGEAHLDIEFEKDIDVTGNLTAAISETDFYVVQDDEDELEITVNTTLAGTVLLSAMNNYNVSADDEAVTETYEAYLLGRKLEGVEVSFQIIHGNDYDDFSEDHIVDVSSGDISDLLGDGVSLTTDENGETEISITFAGGLDKSARFKVSISETDPQVARDHDFGRDFSVKTLPVPFGGGDGSEESPYLIETPEHLHNVRYVVGSHFIVMEDIDLDGSPYNDGEEGGWEPIGTLQAPFSGTFEGNNKTISNLKITLAHARRALFGSTEGADIKNLGLENVDLVGLSNSASLIGRSEGTVITNCYVTGEIEVTGGGGRIGGLVGLKYDGEIRDSYSAAVINPSGSGNYAGGLVGENRGGEISTTFASGEVKGGDGNNYVGGLVGYNSSEGYISNSYATGDVTGADGVGGLVGINHGEISRTYAVGEVTGNSNVGALVGDNEAQVNDSYFYREPDNGIGNQVDEEDMRDEITYDGWDFEDIWVINPLENDGYPILRWQDMLHSHFNVDPVDNHIWGHDWPADAELTIKISSGGEEKEFTVMTGEVEWGDSHTFAFYEETLNIEVGDVVTVSYEDVLVRTHTVKYLTVTEIDCEADIVTGTADEDSWVEVEIHVENHDESPRRLVEADGDGNWEADFSKPQEGEVEGDCPGYELTYEIEPGTHGSAARADEEGNFTRIHWSAPDPRFMVRLNDGGGINGYEWPEETQITVIIEDDEQEQVWHEDDIWTNENGDFDYHIGDEAVVQPGYLVKVSGGGFEKEHVISYLEVTDWDVDADTISGKADPGAEVSVLVHEHEMPHHEWPRREVTADEVSGEWIADFGEAVEGETEPWAEAFSLEPGMWGEAGREDEDGDATVYYWNIPDPHFGVFPAHGMVNGDEWPAEADINVAIDDGNDGYAGTVESEEWGYFEFCTGAFAIEPGYEVTVSAADNGDMIERSHTVTGLTMEIDRDTDTVSGEASVGMPVHVAAFVPFNGYGPPQVAEYIEFEGHEGDWSHTFEGSVEDFEFIIALQVDENGNYTGARKWGEPGDNASLKYFTVGGEDVLELEGIEVEDPEVDEGAELVVEDLEGFAGITAITAEPEASRVVALNGDPVDEGDLADQPLESGDVIVVAVTAEDEETENHYKVTVVSPEAEGQLLDAEGFEGSDFTGVLYTREENIYYNQIAPDGSWGAEKFIGEGEEGRMVIDSDGNPHVAYVTEADSGYDAIGYRMFDGSSWSTEELIESNGDANCSKPDIAVDSQGFAHVTYSDPEGEGGLYASGYNDIMYAENSGGTFERTLIKMGNYDTSFQDNIGDYYNKGSYITVDEDHNYYIMLHHRRYTNPMGFSAYNDYRLLISSDEGDYVLAGYNSSDDRDVFSLNSWDGSLYALYRDGYVQVGGIEVDGGEITDSDVLSETEVISAYSHSISTDDVVIGSKDGDNLRYHYNSIPATLGDIEVAGDAVSIVHMDGGFHAVYTDVADGFIRLAGLEELEKMNPEEDPEDPVSATQVDGGQTLAESDLSGTFRNPQNDEVVAGTLQWVDETLEVNWTANFAWEFIPDNTNIYNEVDGSVEVKPIIRVNSVEDLEGAMWETAEHYVQEADIDLAGHNWDPIGDSLSGYGPFSGIYDGNGYKISNINDSLFGDVEDAELIDITLEDIDVEGQRDVGGLISHSTGSEIINCYVINGTVTGNEYNTGGLIGFSKNSKIIGSYAGCDVIGVGRVGGLVGHMSRDDGESLIIDSYATGDVVGGEPGTSPEAGGLVGRMHGGGEVKGCYATGEVTGLGGGYYTGGLIGIALSGDPLIDSCFATGNVSGHSEVGGLVGQAENIVNSYALGNVEGTGERVGGLVGQNGGPIENCFSAGEVTGDDHVGGLIGFYFTTYAVINSYYDTDVTGFDSDNKGLPRTTLQMHKGTADSQLDEDGEPSPDGDHIYTDWDSDIWEFTPDDAYPTLKNVELVEIDATIDPEMAEYDLDDTDDVSSLISWN